jgi:hypothetical protein
MKLLITVDVDDPKGFSSPIGPGENSNRCIAEHLDTGGKLFLRLNGTEGRKHASGEILKLLDLQTDNVICVVGTADPGWFLIIIRLVLKTVKSSGKQLLLLAGTTPGPQLDVHIAVAETKWAISAGFSDDPKFDVMGGMFLEYSAEKAEEKTIVSMNNPELLSTRFKNTKSRVSYYGAEESPRCARGPASEPV